VLDNPGSSSVRGEGTALELVTFPRVSHVRGNAEWSFPAVGKETQCKQVGTAGCICAVGLMLPQLAIHITGKISTCASNIL